MHRKLYGFGLDLIDMISAKNPDDFASVLYRCKDRLADFFGANRAHALEHEMKDYSKAEDEPDEVYKFANEVADLLCDSASKSEMRETLDELGIMDYLDYIIFMFPEFNLEAAQKIAR